MTVGRFYESLQIMNGNICKDLQLEVLCFGELFDCVISVIGNNFLTIARTRSVGGDDVKWTVKLFRKGSQDGLTSEDIYTPLNLDESKTPANDLERKWNCIVKKIPSKPFICKSNHPNILVEVSLHRNFVILEQIILRNSQPFKL
ncbi:hypothetical protein KQX54_006045 [Cotesia glomerata]|uniref:Uncharacterized protein n=1 Tax=Cotesia glomerata TaxID=32391 RepID=A0AAV7HVV4_COTGL|nr:hypothetical protein KQX54_006045 [Cotesia glomerata]